MDGVAVFNPDLGFEPHNDELTFFGLVDDTVSGLVLFSHGIKTIYKQLALICSNLKIFVM